MITGNELIEARIRLLNRAELDVNTGCMLWIGPTNKHGYGEIRFKWVLHQVHRFSYKIFKQWDIPQGMHICHDCGNPSCVNVEHLYIGTPKQNAQDRHKHGTIIRGNDSWNCKIKDEELEELRRKKLSGKTYKELAQEYGVTKSYLNRICRGFYRRITPIPILWRKRKVRCKELNLVFDSMKDAERHTNTQAANIFKVCSGERKRAGGYTWEYTD